MRILLVMTARTVGGAELYAKNLMAALTTACDFTLAASDHPDLHHFLELVRPYTQRIAHFPFTQGRELWDTTRRLVHLATEHDLVHLNSNHPGSRLGILMGFALPRAGRPVIAVEHSATPISNIEAPSLIAPALPFLFRLSRRKVTRIVTISSESVETLTKLYGLPARKIRLIYPGIDLDRLRSAPEPPTLRRELGLPANVPLILVLGRLNENKGYRELFAALAAVSPSFPTAHVAWAGPVDETEVANQLLARLGLASRVSLLGFRDDVPNLLASSDILVQASHAEGFGLTVVEALAAGLTVIATGTGVALETISDGVNGFLVPPRDAAALADALVRGLSLSPESRATLAVAARAAAAPFGIKEMAQSMLELYREVAATAAYRPGQPPTAA